MWNAFKIAFSMYSKIPMPKTDWNKENMKYAISFFPMVGIVVGAIMMLWGYISTLLNIGDILRSAIFIIIPVIITGGIHIDGFIDCTDALNSYKEVEEKLEILKDSHIGAFALIGCITYFIAYFGIFSEVRGESLILISVGFVLSRALSGLSIVTFPLAKDSGLLQTFSKGSNKKKVRNTMIIYIIICIIVLLTINPLLGLAQIFSTFIVFIYYKKMAIKKFGGITGDIAGYFLEMSELFMALSVVIMGKIISI